MVVPGLTSQVPGSFADIHAMCCSLSLSLSRSLPLLLLPQNRSSSNPEHKTIPKLLSACKITGRPKMEPPDGEPPQINRNPFPDLGASISNPGANPGVISKPGSLRRPAWGLLEARSQKSSESGQPLNRSGIPSHQSNCDKICKPLSLGCSESIQFHNRASKLFELQESARAPIRGSTKTMWSRKTIVG